jgi:hypothetical protein
LPKPQQNRPFPRKAFRASRLAFSDSSLGWRPLAPICGFCQRDVTRNVTRRECLGDARPSDCVDKPWLATVIISDVPPF